MSALSELSVSRTPVKEVSTPAANPLILTLIFKSSTRPHTGELLHLLNEQAVGLI